MDFSIKREEKSFTFSPKKFQHKIDIFYFSNDHGKI